MTARPRPLRSLALALAVALAAAAPAAAPASPAQESIMQSDRLLIQESASVRDAALDEMAALGVDTVRVLVIWRRFAPAPESTARPANFDASDPDVYPPAAWNGLDPLMRGAAARGMNVLLTPTTPGPAWASRCRVASIELRQRCVPSPAEFRLFVAALAQRYSGSFRGLPRATRWGIVNEPNVASWLYPQALSRGGARVPISALVYRFLALYAIDGLRRTGHGRDLILLGETAPAGRALPPSASRPTATLEFWRALLCMDERGQPLRGIEARRLGCGSFRRLLANGVATHPYVLGGSRPPLFPPRRDEITLANLNELKVLLLNAARAGRVQFGLPIHLTEFGLQTDPPDDRLGLSLARQAAYINQADWLAFTDEQVRSTSQFLLVDDSDTGGFQSGLRFASLRRKPSWLSYRMPIWVTRDEGRAVLWGQLRPAPNGSRQVAFVQYRPRGSARWRTVLRLAVRTSRNFVYRVLPLGGGDYRIAWDPGPGRAPMVSRGMPAVAR